MPASVRSVLTKSLWLRHYFSPISRDESGTEGNLYHSCSKEQACKYCLAKSRLWAWWTQFMISGRLCSWTCVLSSNLPTWWMGEKNSTSQKFWFVFFLIRKDEHLLVFLSTLWFCPLSFVAQLLIYFWLSATPWIVACRLPCPSPSPGVCSNSYLLRRRCHPAISSSVVPFVLAGLQIKQLPSSPRTCHSEALTPWLGCDVFAWICVGRVQWTIHST